MAANIPAAAAAQSLGQKYIQSKYKWIQSVGHKWIPPQTKILQWMQSLGRESNIPVFKFTD